MKIRMTASYTDKVMSPQDALEVLNDSEPDEQVNPSDAMAAWGRGESVRGGWFTGTPIPRRSEVDGCSLCDANKGKTHPSHDASERCQSGGADHCACDTCF